MVPRRFVDISMPLENGVKSDPDGYTPKITYFNHHATFEQMAPFFLGLKQSDRTPARSTSKAAMPG